MVDWKQDLALAKERLTNRGLHLVIVKDGRVLWQSDSERVKDLLAYARQATAETRGASMADKVVGKAAALLACAAGIQAIYTPLISHPALCYLAARGIFVEYDVLVSGILNQQGTDLCPLERLTADIHDPIQALEAIGQFYAKYTRD